MSNYSMAKPIGELLQNAGLITPSQIEVALHDQKCYQEMRIGEILALRGWVEQSTVDFFVKEWLCLLKTKDNQPLGFYLKKASLLTEQQINMILTEQHQTCLRFGAIAVLKGFLKQNTLDFFLTNLFPDQAIASSYITRHFEKPTLSTETHYISEEDVNYWVKLSVKKVSGGV